MEMWEQLWTGDNFRPMSGAVYQIVVSARKDDALDGCTK